jgi:hypothetical protein
MFGRNGNVVRIPSGEERGERIAFGVFSGRSGRTMRRLRIIIRLDQVIRGG